MRRFFLISLLLLLSGLPIPGQDVLSPAKVQARRWKLTMIGKKITARFNF